MTQEKSWIETFYDRDSGLEEHFRKVYFDQIDNPPTLEELQEMYPLIFADFYELYKDCYCPDNPDITAKDMVYEDCLEHHNRMLKAELMSWYYGLPVCNAYKNMSKLIEKYKYQAQKQSKQEFLYEQYTIRRNSINKFIFGVESELIFQDAGLNEISEIFDIENPTIFQQLYETYTTAFYCRFFSENRLSSRDISIEDSNLIITALSQYMQNDYSAYKFAPMGNVAGELFDWLKEDEPTFDLVSLANTDYIKKAMDDLGLTQDSKFIGGKRSKSMLLGFVQACKGEGVLPDIADDVICENIAKHIKMDYKARLKVSDKSEVMLSRTIKYISTTKY